MTPRKKREGPIPILAVVQTEDRALLEGILGEECELVLAKTFAEAQTKLRAEAIPVLLYEKGFADVPWERALRKIQQLGRPPCFIVVHKRRHDRLLGKVLNFGGYDVLWKPIEEGWKYVISLAAKSWLGIS